MENEKLHIFSAGRRGKTLFLIALTAIVPILFPNAVKDTLKLIFGGMVIAFLLTPLARFFEKKLSRQKAAVLALICAAAIFALSAAILFPFLFRQISTLAGRLPDTIAQIRKYLGGITAGTGLAVQDLFPSASGFAAFQGNFTGFMRSAIDYAGGIADTIYRFVLMAVLSCFMLADRQRILLRAELLLPFAGRKLIIRHACILLGELKMYIRGQFTIALCVGALAAFALTVFGLPGGILLGAVVGLLNIIPYFGPILGGIPAVLIALGESWQKALATIAALVIIQQIDGMVISPRVMGNATGFSPAVVLLALYAFSRLFGIAGLLFAMPALMAIRTLYRVFVQRYEKN